jgi:hypothetical protein
MTYFYLERQNLIKKSNDVIFCTQVSYISFQTFEM